MSDRELALEIKQHQVSGSAAWFELQRRDFLKVFGGGLLVCVVGRGLAQESGRRGTFGHELPNDIASWLHIAKDGRATAFTGKVEMGQGIRTSLAQQVAEELRVPVDSITMVMGDTMFVPWDAGTFGSRTTPTMGPELRNMAVAAREALVNMAAQEWSVDPTTLVAADGKVTNPASKQSIGYGALTHGQKLVQLVGDPAVTPPAEWKIIGQPVARTNGAELVTGKHQYPSDITRPGMMHGKIVRPSGFNAKLVSVDTTEAEKIPGVRLVRDGDFIGVVAPDSHTASKAAEAIKAEWQVPAQPSNATLFDYLRKNVDANEPGNEHVTGSVEQAMASADVKLEATYTVQYIAHTPLEPRAAVAEWDGNNVTVWTGSQRPFAIKDDLAQALRISPGNIRVIIPDTGSAYGGKHTGDAALEAARLAKAAGKAVKVVWTREEEFTWAYFRPAGVIDVRSGAKKDGTIVAWEFHNYNSGPAAIGTRYDISNQTIKFYPVKEPPLRQGSYRGLAATANQFARESHMDEIAAALKMDPLELRLKNLKDERLRAVLQAAADKFGWGKQKSSAERGVGIACGVEKGGHVATCAEVDMSSGMPNIVRVVEAFECGAVVNPDGLRNQIEGAIVQAIGGALFEQVRFENGRVLNAHMAQYRVPRFADVPKIDVVLVDRKDLPPAGAGETPIMGLAPAVANSIFAATGKRLRGMPLNSAV